METLTIDGKSFVKANKLAKEFGYTSDYIGQLCRGGKVDAQLVGRSWYVDRESLQSHKDGKHKKKSELLNGRVVPATLRRANVVTKPKVSSSFLYDEDETDLIPSPCRQEVEEKQHKLAINIAHFSNDNKTDNLVKNLAVVSSDNKGSVDEAVYQHTHDKTNKDRNLKQREGQLHGVVMGDVKKVKIKHNLTKRISQHKHRNSPLPFIVATMFVAMLLSVTLMSVENVVYIDQESLIDSHFGINLSSFEALLHAYK